MMGGEDSRFFEQASLNGFTMKRTYRAVTYEVAHSERLTFLGQFYRFYWYNVAYTRARLQREPKRDVYLACAYTVPADLFFGSLKLLRSPLQLLRRSGKLKRHAVSGAKRIARGFGALAGLAGIIPSPYRKSVGY